MLNVQRCHLFLRKRGATSLGPYSPEVSDLFTGLHRMLRCACVCVCVNVCVCFSKQLKTEMCCRSEYASIVSVDLEREKWEASPGTQRRGPERGKLQISPGQLLIDTPYEKQTRERFNLHVTRQPGARHIWFDSLWPVGVSSRTRLCCRRTRTCRWIPFGFVRDFTALCVMSTVLSRWQPPCLRSLLTRRRSPLSLAPPVSLCLRISPSCVHSVL